ncbi:MAG: BglII/BstYI family type II restriction endonuclease [Methylophilaceae bacterium]
MDFRFHSHRNALELLENNPTYSGDWLELKTVVENITDQDLIRFFNLHLATQNTKSLSGGINRLLKHELVAQGWHAESPIFQDPEYRDDRWRLDFAKNKIAVEVAFNHGEATSWNLIKPNLSGELNHVAKAIQTEIGIVITATESLKEAGGFDGAVGTYEKFLTYMKPMRQMLTVPILLIGLEKPRTFRLTHEIVERRKRGVVTFLEDEVSVTPIQLGLGG